MMTMITMMMITDDSVHKTHDDDAEDAVID